MRSLSDETKCAEAHLLNDLSSLIILIWKELKVRTFPNRRVNRDSFQCWLLLFMPISQAIKPRNDKSDRMFKERNKHTACWSQLLSPTERVESLLQKSPDFSFFKELYRQREHEKQNRHRQVGRTAGSYFLFNTTEMRLDGGTCCTDRHLLIITRYSNRRSNPILYIMRTNMILDFRLFLKMFLFLNRISCNQWWNPT